MKKIIYTVALLSILTTGNFATAKTEEAPQGVSKMGLFVEPSVTYEIGKTSTNYPAPFSDASGTSEGLGIGARLGFHAFESLFFGIDARYSMPQFKDSVLGYNAKAVSTAWGPVVGMQMPVFGLRIWGSYVANGDLNPDSSGNIDIKFKQATGYRLGTGLRLETVSVNLEYQQIKYNQAELEQLGPFSGSTTFNNISLDNKAWIVSLSFPLEL